MSGKDWLKLIFRAVVSLLLILFVIGIDIYVCQDFKPHYLIMIIPMTLSFGLIGGINIYAFIDAIVVYKHNKNKK